MGHGSRLARWQPWQLHLALATGILYSSCAQLALAPVHRSSRPLRSFPVSGVTRKGVLCGVQPRVDKRSPLAAVADVGPAELEARIRGGGAVVLDIYAVWCGPCKLLEPALDKLAEKLCSGQFERDGYPSPQVLRMDSSEVGRLEGVVGLGPLEDETARMFGLAELSGSPDMNKNTVK
eukprot:Skav226554  [mRNA]  locus=scaffold421:295726:297637:- [translate_table: standard]